MSLSIMDPPKLDLNWKHNLRIRLTSETIKVNMKLRLLFNYTLSFVLINNKTHLIANFKNN